MEKVIQILWTDPQQSKEAGRCETCGGVVYAPSMVCIRCGRDEA